MFFPVVYTQGVPVAADFYSRLMPPICVNQLTGVGYYIDSTGTVQPLASSLTTPISLANGGTGASLTDPNADRILFWDDSAGAVTWLTAGSGLSITDTTLATTGGSAALVLIQAQAASGASQVDFTTGISSTYDTYIIECADVTSSVAGAALRLRVSEDSGSTWKSGASDYAFAQIYAGTSSALARYSNAATTYISLISDFGIQNGVSGTVKFWSPSQSSRKKKFFSEFSLEQPSEYVTTTGSGFYIGSNNAINGVRLYPASGTISGGFCLYGVSKT